MDFEKFVSLISRRALFFSTVLTLQPADPKEGTYSQPVEADLRALLGDLESEVGDIIVHELGHKISNWFLVNAWHMNERESAAMWDLYIREGRGLAVQSTFRR